MKEYISVIIGTLLLQFGANAQNWIKIDSVFSPFGVTVLSFSAPDFADIDGDGDLDLFAGSLSDDRVAFFRNTGTKSNPVFRRDTSLLSSIYAQGTQFTNATYPALADLDADGDVDLVIGGFNRLLMYLNVGDSAHAVWEKDTLLFYEVNPLVGTDARPAFGDIDGDGDLDLLVGIGEDFYGQATPGVTLVFRNHGTSTSPLFYYDSTLSRGIPDVGLNAYPYLRDMDNDGDLDLFMGRDLQTLIYYQNAGTPQSPAWVSSPSVVSSVEATSYWKVPTVCDIDGDGDFDLIYGTSDGTMYCYENKGSISAANLQLNSEYFKLIRIDGSASTVSLADFDKDGDYDLISGNWSGTFQYFVNNGTPSNPVFVKTTGFAGLDAGSYSVPQFVDIDNDGDLDVVSGELLGTLKTYINNNGTFSLNTSYFPGVDIGWQSVPAFADLNNDGLVDVWVGAEESPKTVFLRNAGSGSFVQDNTFMQNVTIPNYGRPALADVDGDGDYDLIYGRSGGALTYYENQGTTTTPVWVFNDAMFAGVKVRQNASPGFADLDNDGKVDLVLGEYSGNFGFYKNNIPTSVNRNSDSKPIEFAVEQNFPNPFNPSTTIRYSLPASQRVRVNVYDMLGREVARLADEMRSEGEHIAVWNAAGYPSGVYVCRVQSGTVSKSLKMLLTK